MYKDKKVMCIYGASGAGSTTLGKALAEKYNFKQYDTDKYFLKYYEDHQRRMDAMMEEIRVSGIGNVIIQK